ncbi:MAG: peptidoglycan-binding protein, partial [Pseudomonadota bacterium]
RLLTSVSLIGAVAIVPATRAEADLHGAIALGAGIIIGNELGKQNRQSVRRAPVQRSGIPKTERGMQTQTALNYFGYNAGSVDGQIGPGTRRAIERYQVSMGYPVNGRSFPEYQFDNLMAAYYWAQNGGQQQTGLFGQQLLMSYKNLNQGQTLQAAAAPPLQQTAPPLQQTAPPLQQQAPLAAANQAVQPLTPPPLQQVAPAPEKIIVAQPTEAPSAFPDFMGTGEAVSLAGHCNTIALQTSTNGGFTKADAVTDPDFALSEQFCLARTYAVETGQRLASSVTGVSADQIEARCGAFGSLLAAQVGSLPTKDKDVVIADVATFIVNSGQQPASLSGTAKICLGVGYRTDDMGVALGSGLVLAALGENAYGELMGHHLSQGFGTAQNAEKAKPWYEMGIEAATDGKAVFSPGQPERVDVIRTAMASGSSASDGFVVVPASDGEETLELFTITSD